MKKLAFYAIAAALFAAVMSGCSQRSSVLNLTPYQSTSNQMGYQKNIRINSIEDARANKSIVATITGSNGNVKEYVTLQNSIESWLQDGLSTELKRLGANLSDFGDIVVDVRIVELKANLSGYSTDNLKGSAKLAITVKRGDQTITKNVSQEQTKFAPIHTSGAFKSFFDELLQDIVKRAAIQILKS